jgi:hypothetical protein
MKGLRARRFVAIDRERGIIFAFAFVDNDAGDARTAHSPMAGKSYPASRVAASSS